MNTEEMKRQFDLLKNITRYSETADLSVDLSQIEDIIFDKLPKEIKKNAPPVVENAVRIIQALIFLKILQQTSSQKVEC